MQFMLFMVAPNTQISKAVISDFAVNDNKPLKIKTEPDYYSEDLKVKINLTGDNLSKLKPADLSVCISFFNNDSKEYPPTFIPVAGASSKTGVSLKDACAGNRYIHTMTLSDITDCSTDQLSFVLRLNNISKELFPPCFNITLRAKDTEDTLAYERTEEIKLVENPRFIKAVMQQPAAGELVSCDSTTIQISMPEPIKWTSECEKFVKITSANPSETQAEYIFSCIGSLLTIERQIFFTPEATYTVSISRGIKAVAEDTELAPAVFTFTTKAQKDLPTKPISIVATNPENGSKNIATDTSSVITVTFDQELNSNTDWSKFVTMTNGSDTLPLTFDYADKTLTIHHSGLESFTGYTVLLTNGIKGVEPFTETITKMFYFTTINAETEYVKALMTAPAQKSNVPVDSPITITFSDEIAWGDACKELVTLSQDETTLNCNYSYSDKVLTIQPAVELLHDKLYTLTISEKLSPTEKYKKLEGNTTFAFTTQRLETAPQITGDSTKAINNRYYLVAGQEFTINFNKPVINESNAKASITLKKNDTEFSGFSVSDFDTAKKLVKVTLTDALEANSVYSISVASFTDDDNSMILPVTENFNALSNIEIVSSNIASGAIDIPIDGSIIVEFSVAVATDAIKLVDNEGNEIATGVVCVTTEKAATIEMTYTDLKYPATYGLLMEYTDNITGQSLVRQVHTFSTAKPEKLILANPNEPNSTDNPYLVYTAKALDDVRNDLSGHYKQMADIDLSPYIFANYADEGWLPIGTDTVSFSGSYDGNNFKISNLTIERSDTDYCGLFCSLTGTLDKINLEKVKIFSKDISGGLVGMVKDGIIQNCTISTPKFNGSNKIGGLAGVVQGGTINNSKVTKVSVSGNSYISGFIGELKGGSIDHCSVDGGNITSYNGTAGGLIAYSATSGTTITNCNTKLETITTYQTAGGLIGEAYSATVEKCNAEITEQIKATYSGMDGTNYLGGLIGSISGSNTTVKNCTAKTNALKEEFSMAYGYVAGLIAYCQGYSNAILVENCSGELNCSVGYCDNIYVGGLIGYCYCLESVTRCSAKLNLSGISDYNYGVYAGGLFGSIYTSGKNTQISECFAECHISAGYYCGGLIGEVYSSGYSSLSTVSINNCYAKGELMSTGYDFYYGGLIGYCYAYYNYGKIQINNSYSDCIFDCSSDEYSYHITGGLIGYKYTYSSGIIDIGNCFTTKTQMEDGSELSIIGTEVTGDTYGSNFRSTDGYAWSGRNTCFSSDWDNTIWDGLDTATPKLKNVVSQE